MEGALHALSIALALLAFALDWLVPRISPSLALPAGTLAALALAAIALSLALTLRLRERAALLSAALFVPAPLLALVPYFGGQGAHALCAAAFAFEARRWFWLAHARATARGLSLAQSLAARLPAHVQVFVDNDIQSEVPLESLREGHLVRMSAGELVPADGVVTFGSAFVDESFTDQADVSVKGMGAPLLAGSRVQNGSLLFRAAATGEQTFLLRLARRLREGREWSPKPWLVADAAVTLLAAGLLATGSSAEALRAFWVGTGPAYLALAAALERGLQEVAISRRWLFEPGAARALARAGMLVFSAPGVLTEARPRLQAVDCRAGLGEDAALSLLGPIARKLETPAAFALLQELRTRNIPLELGEFFQTQPGGGAAIVSGTDVRWLDPPTLRAEGKALGELEPFVAEHSGAGEEVVLLEHNGAITAALAFRDAPLPGVEAAAEELRRQKLPLLLLSCLPRATAERQRGALGLEHVLAEAGPAESAELARKLAASRLRPAWVANDSAGAPAGVEVVIAAPERAGGWAQFVPWRTDLASLALASGFARATRLRFQSALALVAGAQLGLLLLIAGSHSRFALAAGLARPWPLSDSSLALAGVLPAALALLLARPARTLLAPLPPNV